MRTRLSVVLWFVAATQGLSGQQESGSPLLVPGARVRVWSHGHEYTGALTAISNDSVWLTSKGPVALPRTAVERIDVSMGRHGHTLLGLGIGFGVGFLGGVAVGRAVGDDNYGFGPDPAQIGAWLGTWAGCTVIGGVVGALSKSDVWARIPTWSPVPAAKPTPIANADTTVDVPDPLGEAARQLRFGP